MKSILTNNTISTSDLNLQAKDYIPATALLQKIIIVKNKEKTKVEHIRYDFISQSDLSTFSIKVISEVPFLSVEEFEKSTSLTYVDIPLDQVSFRIYEAAYGKAKVTITAPYLKLHEAGDKKNA